MNFLSMWSASTAFSAHDSSLGNRVFVLLPNAIVWRVTSAPSQIARLSPIAQLLPPHEVGTRAYPLLLARPCRRWAPLAGVVKRSRRDPPFPRQVSPAMSLGWKRVYQIISGHRKSLLGWLTRGENSWQTWSNRSLNLNLNRLKA